MVASIFRKYLHLMYIGTYFAKMHLTSYLTSILNAVLWFALVFGPTVVFSPDPVRALRTFLPGTIGFTAASIGMWVSTEFLRWYVYHGLTDMFRECGLGVLHYLICGIHIDLLIDVVLGYFAVMSFASLYVGFNPSLVLPEDPLLFLLAIALAVPPYLLCGSLIAYLYVKTPIGGVWTNVIQMAVVMGTIIPPATIPIPELTLINPATLTAEIARASYGTNTIDKTTLLTLTPIITAVQLALTYIVTKQTEKQIAKQGIRYRV